MRVRDLFVFRSKKRFLELMCVLNVILATLGVPWHGLACDPYALVQSKPTFRFSEVFRKQLLERHPPASFRLPFSFKIWILCGKQHARKKHVEQSAHPSQKWNVLPFPKSPSQPPSRAHFSDKKQVLEHKFQKLLLERVSCA